MQKEKLSSNLLIYLSSSILAYICSYVDNTAGVNYTE